MAKKQDKYIRKIGGIFYFRKRHNGKPVKRSLNTSDRPTARDLRDLYLANLVEYGQLDPPKEEGDEFITFGEVAKQWADVHKTQVRYSTWPDYVSAMNGHILPVFKDAYITEITYLDVIKFRSRLKVGSKRANNILVPMKQLLDTLKAEGIAENTLVVWISDNGPMYAFYPNSGYSWLKGGKGAITEGGVRVPAMAWWPGMIAPNQDPVDILHITDLFTTAARLGGALGNIPNDRVTDGVDQTALLLLGEDHGRRNMMFHYSGGVLGAIRYEDFKVHITEGHGGLPGMDFYNVMRDPGEKYGELYPGLFAVTPIQITLREHMKMIQKFPHRVSEITPKGAELTPHD